MKADETFDSYVETLTQAGFPLIAVFDLQQLPPSVIEALAAADVGLNRYRRLVLIGNAGKSLWPHIEPLLGQEPDPIDSYTRRTVDRMQQQLWPQAMFRWLYPLEEMMVPLLPLGKAAGWGEPSPLGLSISAQYGLWFAARGAFLIDVELPLRQENSSPLPCDSCIAKPCISACPVRAVGEIGAFSTKRCLPHRLAPNSACSHQCLSRLACPVAPEHQYPMGQLAHHYGSSLESIRIYLESGLAS